VTVRANTSEKEGYVELPEEDLKKLLDGYNGLAAELAELKRQIYGRKSERFVASDENQLGLFQVDAPEQAEAEYEELNFKRRKGDQKKKPVRTEIPSHLPRTVIVIEPDNIPTGARKIGEEISEVMDIIPMTITVTRTVRPKYSLPNNEGVLIADLPSRPIERGNAGASLLAYIQVAKWVDHLPYYRQGEIFKRNGITIASSTINDWFNATCELLQPLYDCLVKTVKRQEYLQADETPIKVLDNNKKKATHTGFHWVYHAPWIQMVAFDYQPSRSGSGPEAFLKDFQGVLQTDGYVGYNAFASKGIVLLACMAHARRYFEKALDNDKVRAQWMLKKIQWLYHIERQLHENDIPSDHKLDVRQRQAIPTLNEMKAWLDINLHQVAPKSRIGKAIAYMLTLWDRLVGYTTDGDFLIDNNLIENTIRPVALGRKNYLFAGSHKAAQHAAMMYSFFGTCKLQGIEPYEWLKTTLERISDHKANRLAELLPGYVSNR
jgi:transposase